MKFGIYGETNQHISMTLKFATTEKEENDIYVKHGEC